MSCLDLPSACCSLVLRLALGICITPLLCAQTVAPTPPTTHLRIVGGLARINQYTRHEEPFWTRSLPQLSSGSLRAEIVPFDRAGIRGQDMLRLLQLGVLPFGTAPLGLAVAQEPLIGAVDLPGLNPDMATLHRSVAAFRPVLAEHLRQRLGLELLAVYAYPAQVLFCKQPFAALADLRGRRVRVSVAAMADLFEALGALPVLTTFAEIGPKLAAGALDCVVTGTMSGNTIGLPQATSHLHTLAIGWGLSLFAANGAAWGALHPAHRSLLQQQLPRLEQDVWDEADRETGEGIACNSGDPRCTGGQRGRMQLVQPSVEDRALLQALLAQTVLPRWLARCGPSCAAVWNSTLAPVAGVRAGAVP